MANILVLTSYYLEQSNVLSNNVRKIVDELCKSNTVVCISEELNVKDSCKTESLKVVTTKTSLLTRQYLLTKKRIFIWLNRFKSLFLLFRFPNIDGALTRRKTKLAEKEFEYLDFDVVIAFYRQYSNIKTMENIKRTHPNVRICAVFLDLLEAYVPFGFTAKKYELLCGKIEEYLLKNCDLCLFPANIEKKITEKFGKNFGKKIGIFDYPLYQYRGINSHSCGEKIKLLYAGTVDIDYRNPMKLLETLNLLENVCDKFEVDMYIHGNCTQQVVEFSKNSKFDVNVYGLIDHDTLMKKMDEADILINISNISQNAVPSKIFEIASFGKPLLDYSFSIDDYTNGYFERYPNAYILKDWEHRVNSYQDKLENFIVSAREKVLERRELDMLFRKNTAVYFVEQLQPVLFVKEKK